MVVFSILVNKERVGYISEFSFLENIDNKYVYHIRLKYYDEKIFKNSDIFGVYAKDTENVNWDGGGAPFGRFISDKEMSKDDKIDIVYITKVRTMIWTYVFLILIVIVFLYKIIKYDFNIYKNTLNIECKYINLDPHIEKIYTKCFIAFIALLSLFIFSVGFITPVQGDDWYFATFFDVYHIFDFSDYRWQRGRHIADLLMMLPMAIFAQVGIGFGLEPLMSVKIMHGIFRVIFMLGQFFALSTLVYLFNNKKQFKTIFIIVTIFSIQFFKHYYTSGLSADYMLNTSAYVGSAALSLAAWLPFAYFWIYDKELDFFNKNPNKLLMAVIYTFVLYAGTFTLEVSSLPIAGLSFFMLCYYIFVDKRVIKCDESKDKLPLTIVYYNLAIILLTVISFILTFVGGRGVAQLERMETVTIKNPILNPLGKDGNIIATVVIMGIIYMLYLVIKAIKHKKISKINYIKITLIAVGLLGAFGFSVIGVSYALSLLFIVSSLILCVLDGLRRRTSLSQIGIPVVIILMLFEIFIFYQSNISYNYSAKTDRKLVELFVDADEKDKDEILLTRSYLTKNKLRFTPPVSSYMLQYGYTRDYIKIRVIEDEDLEYEKSDDLNNKKLIYSYPE